MNVQNQISNTLNQLFEDSKKDQFKIMKSLAKSILRPMRPSDFKDVYLSISKEQGKDLVQLIKDNNLKNIVEFGTSFGISTLFLAQGILENEGEIVTTELLETKAKKAIENFEKAGVENLIEVKIGNAMETLKNYNKPIDLLFLDGWKDLYLPLFLMLEHNFHDKTIVYVDNADMADSKTFLNYVKQNTNYFIENIYKGKAVLITNKN